MTEIQGFCDPHYEPVRMAFEENFSKRGEVGAAVAVLERGETVVELWAGVRDAYGSPWERDTLVLTYSTTKPFSASCALLLAGRGELHLDDAVTKYWPEFGRAGKNTVTVRQMLSHQAGLIALREDLPREAIFDRERIVKALEDEEPWWTPGTKHGEHAYFFGHLIEELVRRVDGRSLHDFFAEEIAEPWNLDFHIGLDEGGIVRAAHLFGIDEAWPNESLGEPGSVFHRALTNPPAALSAEVVNSAEWKMSAVPAINGYGTAAAIARFYAGFISGGSLDGVRLFSEAMCREATSTQSSGVDEFLGEPVDWGLGFQVEEKFFGHGGLGGSSGYAVRETGSALAYVTNKMAGHDRADATLETAERCAAGV